MGFPVMIYFVEGASVCTRSVLLLCVLCGLVFPVFGLRLHHAR